MELVFTLAVELAHFPRSRAFSLMLQQFKLSLNTYALSGSVLGASCVFLLSKLGEAGTGGVTQWWSPYLHV